MNGKIKNLSDRMLTRQSKKKIRDGVNKEKQQKSDET